MSAQAPPHVRAAFASLREKLIDKSKRNRMLNYKTSARASVGLDITQELAAEIWKTLVVNHKGFGFTGPEDPKKDALSDEIAEEPIQSTDTLDRLLYTPVATTKRQSRLLATYRAAQEQMEERGVNSLYLTLGMLEWKEPEEHQTWRAPLILIPVVLERTKKGDFILSYEEGEISTNLSLKAKLQEYSIELPEIPADFESFVPTAYFEEVTDTVMGQAGWRVHPNEVVLNFFSFEKIALYVDLEESLWPVGVSPLTNQDITALLGDGYPGGSSPLTDDTHIDNARSIEDSREVFEADSSQILVMLEANRGTSMVVEGPPGTGKSQTIANLIADLVSRGKRILFVSEKMTALEVVHRRLEEAGLGEATLKLHGQKSNRRSFYTDVKSTWFKKSQLQAATQKLARLTELRNELNQYVDELHKPLDPYGVSPRRLIALACQFPPATEEDLSCGYDSAPLQDCSWSVMERHREDIRTIQEKVRQIGVPSKHPFWGSALEFFGPDERVIVTAELREAEKALAELKSLAHKLAERLKVPSPETLEATGVLHNCVQIALSAPPLTGVELELAAWNLNAEIIRASLGALTKYQAIAQNPKVAMHSEAWEQDWGETHSAISQNADSFVKRLLSADYKTAIKKLTTYLQSPAKLSPADAKSLAASLFEAQAHRKVVLTQEALFAKLYGVQWQGLQSSPERLSGLLEWVLKLEKDCAEGSVPSSLLEFFTGNLQADGLQEASDAVRASEKSLTEHLEKLTRALKLSSLNLSGLSLDELATKLSSWSEDLGRIGEIIGWNQVAKVISERDKALMPVLILASQWPLAGERLETLVVRTWAQEGLKRARQARAALARFDRTRHQDNIAEFRRLDAAVLEHNKARASHAHLTNLPPHGSVGLTAELFRQCELKRGHKSIRWAFEKFGDLILKIKPVCMMSPLSVAAFLPRRKELFDVVIFDEASQVKPEDALSAVSRASQIIVVGDSKQMPPTSFFDSLVQDDIDEDAEFDQTIGKMESILALCSGAVQNSFRRRDLRWHYRSLHQALIQPSNHLFYEDRLVVFPSNIYSTQDASSELGLRFRYNPNATYDRGSSNKVNLAQATEVAEAVLEQLTERPQESLMVVAFSKDQQKAVLDAVDRLVSPQLLAEYAALHPFEKFDVKNLETAQGDERDVVFISVGYGRDAKGALSMNFGPINREDGGRRLNVLMSRSKKRMEVFTSIRGADITTSADRETGLTALKQFLQFAETGLLEHRGPTGQEPDSDFEEQVRDALQAHGFDVDCQVGTAGFRIDLAVRHPELPGLYVLGIECDGATYHSAKSARDRDKLRQQVLESRGWRLYRLWSTDWWMDRQAATNRLLAAINEAIELSEQPSSASPMASATTGPNSDAQTPEELKVWTTDASLNTPAGAAYVPWNRPFQLDGYQIHELPPLVMAQCVEKIVGIEGPVHLELVIKRIRDSAGLGRAGDRIRNAVVQGIQAAESMNTVDRRGDFLYKKVTKAIFVPTGSERNTERLIVARTREKLPNNERNMEWIAPEEIQDAILKSLKSSHTADAEQICEGVQMIFGFKRRPDLLPAMVESELKKLLFARLVEAQNSYFFMPSSSRAETSRT